MDWLKSRSLFIMVSFLSGTLLIGFLVAPIAGAVLNSAGGLFSALTDSRTLSAIYTSFYCAFLAAFVAFALGIPFAYLFTRHSFPGKQVIDSLIDIPIIIPHNAAGIALLAVTSSSSPIGSLLDLLGIRLVDTILGIVVAMTFVSAPFMVRSAQEAFMAVNPTMEQVARSLGASDFQVFINITLPLGLRGIFTGFILTWARAVSEFGAVVILAYYPKTIPIHLYDVFVSEGLKAALPINGLLILIALFVLFSFKLVTTKIGT